MRKPANDNSTLVLTNLKKIFWPEQGYTKGDLLDYYKEMAAILVPYMHNRPQSMHRHPDGWNGKDFYQRISKGMPSWVQVASVKMDGKERDFVLCQDWPTLLWMANFGCIEFIPWNSRIDSLDRPDYLIVDLDPGDVPFQHVVETAQTVHRLLDRIGADSLCKTSGKRGLHIYVPLGRKYAFAQAKSFADIVAHLVHQKLPEITSRDPRRANRQQQIYLDCTRNSQGQSVAAAYSARPWLGATASTPLKWSEVRRGLDPARYTIKSLPRRVEKLGDLWQPVLGPGIDLAAAVNELDKVMSARSKKS